jgi:hypothetical protein
MKPDRDTTEPLEQFLARVRSMSSAGYKRLAAGETERSYHQVRRKGVQRRPKTASGSRRGA